MSSKQQKPQTAPEVQIAFAEKLLANKNEALKTGSSSITGAQIISENTFCNFTFDEFLINHGIDVSDDLETLKAATTALTTKIEPGGLRGAALKVLAPQATQNDEVNVNRQLPPSPEESQ